MSVFFEENEGKNRKREHHCFSAQIPDSFHVLNLAYFSSIVDLKAM